MISGLEKSFWIRSVSLLAGGLLMISCDSGTGSVNPVPVPVPDTNTVPQTTEPTTQTAVTTPIVDIEPTSVDDLENRYDYVNQEIPAYIDKDNTGTNTITDGGAALGRVLFYDTALSTDGTVACANCHQQAIGFSDANTVSDGVNGVTGRHSMRLINTRFADESRFFWDERAESLEEQVTQPIRDHAEMGFSGTDRDTTFEDLLARLDSTSYYPVLFTSAFGNSLITEARMQDALAQFIRSIVSFDSRYDKGRSQARNNNSTFTNFTAEENEGKRLFMERGNFDPATGQRQAGSGLGCNQCHRAPEFDIDENSRNNGVISVAGNILATDVTNTRSPTLRNLFNNSGGDNGPFMHDGSLTAINDVLDHYNDITIDRVLNRNLDNRLTGSGPGGNNNGTNNSPGQKLLLTDTERSAVIAFMKTLTGENLYTDPKWSNPFSEDGSLILSR